MPRHLADAVTPAGARPQATEPSQEPSFAAELLLLLIKVALVGAFAALVLVFLFGVFQQADESMGPAVREGDLIVFYRLQKDYAAGDLVVVNDGEGLEVRRVVATAGDVVDFDESGLVINGYRQQESRIYVETLPFAEGVTYPLTVGEGQVFVLGDARTQSRDSRLYGAVDVVSGTEGEVMTVIRRRNL